MIENLAASEVIVEPDDGRRKPAVHVIYNVYACIFPKDMLNFIM